MFFLLSGEGATDLGRTTSDTEIAEGDDYHHGPMAVLIHQIIEKHNPNSRLASQACGFVSEKQLGQQAATMRHPRQKVELAGEKFGKGSLFFTKNARALATIAMRQEKIRDDVVVAILFRDADGTGSSKRNEWEVKRQSMVNGFKMEGFTRGVPMIPKPKSEAWLICALKENPYQGCDALEGRPGNDGSPNPLKKKLEALLAKRSPGEGNSLRERLNGLVENRTVDFEKITMPSFRAFREDLERIIAPHAVEPA